MKDYFGSRKWWIVLLVGGLGALIVFFSGQIVAQQEGVTAVKPVISLENGSVVAVFFFERGETGKNRVVFPFDMGMDAKTLLAEHAEIDAITDLSLGRAYVRAFGGIGKNFVIGANQSYEVSVIAPFNITVIR